MSWGVLFSGQGAQKPGMGLDFMVDPLFKETIEQASAASGQELVQIFASENDELAKTVNVQPALVAFEAGIYRMLQRDLPELKISGMAGLSLGEYGAMFASGALDLADTLALVRDRAQYMQEDADAASSTMAALIKPDLAQVEEILDNLRKADKKVYLANFNSPKQAVIGGLDEDVALAKQEIIKAQAAKRVIGLRVNGAFHTPLFNNAKAKMHERLKKVSFKQNTIPVISNTTGKPFENNWAAIMEKQLAVPTHFAACLQYLIKQQKITATLEIGPGKTLTAFARQVDSSLANYRIGSLTEYQEFVEENHEN